MSNLTQERSIMASNDGSITLTTHRVVQRTPSANREIMLVDFLSYEVVNKKINYYKFLMIFFLSISLISGIWAYYKNQEIQHLQIGDKNHYVVFEKEADPHQREISMNIFIASLVLSGISVILFLRSSQKYLRINGKFSSFEFSMENLGDASFSKFVNALVTESDNRKRE